MATRKELEDMLLRADEAGDTEAAKLFVEELERFDAAQKPSAKQQYDQMGPFDKAVTAAGDVARIIGSSTAMGFGEKGLAGVKSLVGQGEYDDLLKEERRRTAEARERAGGAGVAASFIGPVKLGSELSRAGLTLMQSAPNLPFIQRLLGTAAAGGIEGGAYGALDALGHDEAIASGAKTGAAFGAGGGALAELASSAANAFGNRGLGHNKAPTPADLENEANRLRASIQGGADIDINPDAIADLNDTLRRNVGEGNPQGARPDRHKATISELKRLREYSPSTQDPTTRFVRVRSAADGNTSSTVSKNGGPRKTNTSDFVRSGDVERLTETRNMSPDRGMTLYDLDQHRQTVSKNVAVPDPADRMFGGRIIDQIDEFARSLDDTTARSRSGRDIHSAVETLEEARGLDHRRLKYNEIDKLRESARRAAEASGGQGAGNQLRQSVAHMLDDDLAMRGYSELERKLMEDLVEGTKKADRWRSVSRFASGTGGMAVGSATGAGIGGLAGGGLPGSLAGAAAGPGVSKLFGSFAANRAAAETTRQADVLLDTIARGGPKAPRQTTQFMTPSDTEALRRALVILGLEDQHTQQRKEAAYR